MPDQNNKIYLYEALELRAEYNSRLNTYKDLLPEAQNTGSGLWDSSDDVRYRPVEEFDVENLREKIKNLEYKQRKLNNAIQEANYETFIEYNGREINLTEALDLRKAVNDEIKELRKKLQKAAYEKVIYKEDRDIVEEPEISYTKMEKELEKKRKEFRKLNRKLREISFATVIDFKDEK